ncbi:MAG: pantetheine-phosphate adenylyltransferase [Treponemataceae bacterium]
MASAIFAGSFDPPTYGHMDIIERSRQIFDEIHVVVSVNSAKTYLFSSQEREEMLKAITSKYSNVKVHVWSGFIVDFAEKIGANVLVRGVRNMADFNYEFDLSIWNRSLGKNMETVFLPTDPRFFVIKSSAIKELASLGGDISSMVPKIVSDALKKKYTT